MIELPGPVIDPETFAQDIRRLLDQDTDKLSISLWNALTVIAIPYHVGDEKVVELVNYSQEPIAVQVRIKGSFSSIRYEAPERACCVSLTPEYREGFTEFVVPDLRIAGRVHLSNKKAARRIKGVRFSLRTRTQRNAYFHFPSPSTIVMYRSRGRSVKRSTKPLGCGHFTSIQSIFLRCTQPQHHAGIVG